MKEIKNSNQGFTLLELLVVVLIIGILAAIALPQYQLAVDKAKYSNALQIIKRVEKMEDMYYTTYGSYTYQCADFISEFPSCHCRTQNITKCSWGEIYLNGWGYIDVSYSPVSLQATLKYGKMSQKSVLYCGGNDSKRIERLCTSLGGINKSPTSNGNAYWTVPN